MLFHIVFNLFGSFIGVFELEGIVLIAACVVSFVVAARYTSNFALPVYDEDGNTLRYNVFRIEMLVRHAIKCYQKSLWSDTYCCCQCKIDDLYRSLLKHYENSDNRAGCAGGGYYGGTLRIIRDDIQ